MPLTSWLHVRSAILGAGTWTEADQQENFRRRDVPTKARITYIKNRLLQLKLQTTKEDQWTVCFEAEVDLPPQPYLGFSALTGDVSDNHESVFCSGALSRNVTDRQYRVCQHVHCTSQVRVSGRAETIRSWIRQTRRKKESRQGKFCVRSCRVVLVHPQGEFSSPACEQVNSGLIGQVIGLLAFIAFVVAAYVGLFNAFRIRLIVQRTYTSQQSRKAW